METIDNFVVKETKIHYGFNNRFLYVYAIEVLKLLELSLDNPLSTYRSKNRSLHFFISLSFHRNHTNLSGWPW